MEVHSGKEVGITFNVLLTVMISVTWIIGVPENDAFIESVSRGVCPPELVKDGQPQHVKLEDKTGEDYVPPVSENLKQR